MDNPVAIMFDGSDSLYFTQPLLNISHKPFSYTRVGDSLTIFSGNRTSYGLFSDEDEQLACTINGMKLKLKLTERPDFVYRPQLDSIQTGFIEEKASFKSSQDSIMLSGSFMLPQMWDEHTPCVIFVAGSGAQDRDETIFNHKIFKVLAMHLAENGIASLRYDKRGVGKSEGDFGAATVADFVADAQGAINYLRSLNKFSKVGLLGHSEGGMVASALGRDHAAVDFYILLGSPAVPMDELLYDQSRLILETSEIHPVTREAVLKFNQSIYPLMKKNMIVDSLPPILNPMIDKLRSEMDSTDLSRREYSPIALYASVAQTFYSDYVYSFLNFPAEENFRYMREPVLAIYGGKDLQVSYALNYPALEKQLQDAPTEDYKVLNFPECNHLMQYSETGSPTEYLYNTISVEPEVMDEITKWIVQRFLE